VATSSENYLSLVRQAFFGELKLPAFQRDFKWNRKQVVLLYDSIRQAYPLGSVIFLEGTKEEIKEREFKGAKAGAIDIDAKRLVLDGQQRLTAGIDLFYGESKESKTQYFIDLNKLEVALHELSVDIEDEEAVLGFIRQLDVDSGYCIARPPTNDPFSLLEKKGLLSTMLLRSDNSKHRDYWLDEYILSHPERKSLIRNVVKPHLVIHQSPDIPSVSVDSNLQLDAISRIFATLNSSGKVLTPFELVVAVMYAGDIDLRSDLDSLRAKRIYLGNMDPTGEITLQTVVLLNGGNHKKSMLPKTLKAEDWRNTSDRAAELLDNVGEFLTKNIGMGLDKKNNLIPYDSIFAPMAIVFDNCSYMKMSGDGKGRARAKILRWVVGASLSQRYQEGVHTKQANDARQMVKWILKDDPMLEPTWLQEVSVPALRSVSLRGAVANILKCISNMAHLKDPVTGDVVNFGDPGVHIHHIFPKKYVEKLDSWNPDAGDKFDLILNTMPISNTTNASFLNDDPYQQIARSIKIMGQAGSTNVYQTHGISTDAVSILQKASKTREDYWNFIKVRETYFESRLTEFGFSRHSGEAVHDDLEDA